jgi:hypothetical protein
VEGHAGGRRRCGRPCRRVSKRSFPSHRYLTRPLVRVVSDPVYHVVVTHCRRAQEPVEERCLADGILVLAGHRR